MAQPLRSQDLEAALAASAASLVDELLRFEVGESLLVYVDGDTDPRVADAILAHARGRGERAERLDLSGCGTRELAESRLLEAIGGGAWDVVCELTGQYYYASRAWAAAAGAGSRLYTPGSLQAGAFVRCVGGVDHAAMRDFGARLHALFVATRSVRMTSREGTDLRCAMNPHRLSRLADKLRGRPRSCVWEPSGQPLGPGQATFLAGQLAFLGRPESIEGRAVVDGFQWPPGELGALREPIVLTVARGVVTGIDGGEQAETLRRWFGEQPRPVLHLCLGFNPGARMDGELCEAERAPGALTIGFGEHPFHSDAVLRRPSIELSQGPIEIDGRFVHPQLRELAGRLGAAPPADPSPEAPYAAPTSGELPDTPTREIAEQRSTR